MALSTTVNQARWQRLSDQLDALLDMQAAEREARLEQIASASADDANLLRAWLSGVDRAGREQLPFMHDGQRIGPWRVIDRIDRGGMGDVWLAARADQSYEKKVAFKFLHEDSPRLREHLDRERRLLAQLDHPNIARLLDGGTTEKGQPYFIADFIEGAHIDRWCRDKNADLKQRLDLFRQTCSAVAYAHDHLIVHRDIKPSNIMVNAEGRVYVLDFGIAQILQSEARNDPAVSKTITPDFAAPEQLTGGFISTRTDIYQLGVLLYFLLTGRPPLRRGNLAYPDFVEYVRGQMPEAPSQVADAAVTLPRRLGRDFDAIVLKALAKAPEDRYATVGEFVADIDHALGDEPVAAIPATAGDRVLRFARRNKLSVALAVIGALCLLAGIAGTLWQARQALISAQRARTEAATAVAVRDFLIDIFKAADPEHSLGKPVTAVDLVNTSAAELKDRFRSQPTLGAEFALAIGEVYVALGKPDLAIAPLQKGLAQAGVAGDSIALTDHLAVSLAQAEIDANRKNGEENIARLDRAIAHQRTLPLEQRTALVSALAERARYEYERDASKALAYYQESIAAAREIPGTTMETLLESLLSTGKTLSNMGHAKDALVVLDEARKSAAPFPLYAAKIDWQYALSLIDAGRAVEGEPILRDALARMRNIFGEQHITYATALADAATRLLYMGKTEEAEAMLRTSLAVIERVASDSVLSGAIYNSLAIAASKRGDIDAARLAQRRSLDIAVHQLGSNNDSVRAARLNLAIFALSAGDVQEAEQAARELLVEIPDGQSKAYAVAEWILGRALLAEARPEEALYWINKAVALFEKTQGAGSSRALLATISRAAAERDLNRFAQARSDATKALAELEQRKLGSAIELRNAHYLVAQLDYLDGHCSDSLAALDAQWRADKEATSPHNEVAEAESGLMAGLCRQQINPADGEARRLAAASAKSVLSSPKAGTFFKMLANRDVLKKN